MGIQNSKELKFRDNSLLSFGTDDLEYNGIKSSEENLEEDENIFYEENNMTKSSISNDKINRIEPNKIPFTFEWELDGNFVFLSGSFCNWDQFFLMEKQPDGKHVLTLNLKKGFIQYKYKVDNIWKCNDKFPIIDDNGIQNNYIDTTNWEISVENTEEATTNTETSFKQNDNKSINLSMELQNAQKNYTNYIPKPNELNSSLPKIPEQYMKKIDFENSNLANSSEEESYNNLFLSNNDYKSIKPIIHEKINHLNYKINNNNVISKEDKNSVVCSIVSRHRLKFTTFVYYKAQ
jgi:hypothetical protein